MLLPLLIILFFIIPHDANAQYAAPYDCKISISSSILPVLYNEENRGNPDDTFYPGDGFHYLFKFKGSDTCRGFGPQAITSEGAYNVLSHNISHDNLDMAPKYLTTFHWYEIIGYSDSYPHNHHCKCAIHMHSDPIFSDGPIFSYREDQKLTQSDAKNISYYSKYSDKYLKTETQAWGFTKIGENHPHGIDAHIFEDASSIDSFENSVKNQCSDLGKNEGCVFGHVEIDTEIQQTKCLIEELDKIGTSHNLQESDDVCVDITHQVSLSVKGLKRVCGVNDRGHMVCKTITVTNSAGANPTILEPGNGINLLKNPLPDTSGYDAKNLDGTYYVHDPLTITHIPDLKWKNERAETIQFTTEKIYELKKEYDYDCIKNECDLFLESSGVQPHNVTLGNGDGITIYNATSDEFLGIHTFDYSMNVYNMNRKINSLSANTEALVVKYDPQYTNYPYPRIADDQRYSFDDRQAVALHYFGSNGGGTDDMPGTHQERRSLINGFHQAGFMFDPWYPVQTNQTFAWSGANNSGIIPEVMTNNLDIIPAKEENSSIIPLETYGNDAMFVKSGYGKVFFDYPLSSVIFDNKTGAPKYENVTSYVTLKSSDFAGDKVTYLTFWEYMVPESSFVTNLIIKTINQNGTITDNPIHVVAEPQLEYGAVYLTEYLDEKITHDSKDQGLAKVIVDDTYPMTFDYSSIGVINEKLRRTASQFQQFENITYETNSEKEGIFQISENYLKESKELRLQIPLEVGLTALSPTNIIVDVNGKTKTIDAQFIDFGTDREMLINVENDNVLKTKRGLGFLTIYHDEHFGGIEKISVNDEMIHAACLSGCTIPVNKTSTLLITAWNEWGGTTHAELPEYIITEIPKTSVSQINPIISLLVLLPLAYILYRKLHSNN